MNRPGLRESVGTAVNASNLASDTLKEHPIDRVAAMARADEFGSVLWRLKAGGDRTVLKRAALLLSHRAWEDGIKAGSWELRTRICERVINEWLQDKCTNCKGRGRTGMGKGVVISTRADCPMCSGSGLVPHIGRLSLLLMGMGTKDGEPVEIQMAPCGSCAGRGKVWHKKEIKEASLGKPCSGCGGTGQRRINGAERARIVGVSAKNYWKSWDRRFWEIRRLVREADGEAGEDIRTALRGPRKEVDEG